MLRQRCSLARYLHCHLAAPKWVPPPPPQKSVTSPPPQKSVIPPPLPKSVTPPPPPPDAPSYAHQMQPPKEGSSGGHCFDLLTEASQYRADPLSRRPPVSPPPPFPPPPCVTAALALVAAYASVGKQTPSPRRFRRRCIPRCSVHLRCWHKSTNTDAAHTLLSPTGGADQTSVLFTNPLCCKYKY